MLKKLFIFALLFILITGCSGKENDFDKKVTAGKNEKLIVSIGKTDLTSARFPYFNRSMHINIISEDFNIFGHIHPEDFNKGEISEEMALSGEYPVYFNFPRSGKYLVGADLISELGLTRKRFNIKAEGNKELGQLDLNFSQQKKYKAIKLGKDESYTASIIFDKIEGKDGEHEVTLELPDNITVNKTIELKLIFKKNGKPINNLIPYLGAASHTAIAKEDLSSYDHTHAIVPGGKFNHEDMFNPPKEFGPEIVIKYAFPEPGIYVLFSQSRHEENLIASRFLIKVEE